MIVEHRAKIGIRGWNGWNLSPEEFRRKFGTEPYNGGLDVLGQR